MKKFVNNKMYGKQKQESELVIDRIITYLIINKFIKETLFKNKTGFWNERLNVYDNLNKYSLIKLKFYFRLKKKRKL